MIVKPADRTGKVQEYYFSQKLAQIDRMRREGADIINLGIGSPDQPPSDNTVNVLINEARKPWFARVPELYGDPGIKKCLFRLV